MTLTDKSTKERRSTTVFGSVVGRREKGAEKYFIYDNAIYKHIDIHIPDNRESDKSE
jgi:hypothetical protein